MRREQTTLLESISSAFPPEPARCCLTLRQGSQIDSYDEPSPDTPPPDWRDVSDTELERYHWGLNHIDAESWLFYLPAFLSYAVRFPSRVGSLAISASLNNLRPPDRNPSRYRRLTDAQRKVVVAVLDFLAFDAESAFSPEACQVLEEYWIEPPLYPDL